MKYEEFYKLVLKESRGNDPDTDFFAFAPKELQDFRRQVFDDGRVSNGSISHKILWRPCKYDTINGSVRGGDSFPKEFDLNAFYKATTIPLKGVYDTYPLNGSLSPMIKLNVQEGPYKGTYSSTSYYGVFPPTYLLKRNLSPETLKTFEELIDEL